MSITSKSYSTIQYASHLDELPADLGGKNNCWRCLTLEGAAIPSQMNPFSLLIACLQVLLRTPFGCVQMCRSTQSSATSSSTRTTGSHATRSDSKTAAVRRVCLRDYSTRFRFCCSRRPTRRFCSRSCVASRTSRNSRNGTLYIVLYWTSM